ncbi:MAG: hypothetical protein NZO58_02805 [Gemmataceae bacterium]|nr:hypothetical protein [Gemmataceae bacterium]
MRFALLGDHADGVAVARALAATGRHALTSYCGPAAAMDMLARDGLAPRRISDAEEALADPEIDLVVVAGRLGQRGQQVRRALQSEHHVLCVHPIDPSADLGHEMAMLSTDVQRLLVPLLPEGLHPGFQRLTEFVNESLSPEGEPPGPRVGSWLGPHVRLVILERCWPESFVLESDADRANLPGWDVLRRLGGEIAEVSALAASEQLSGAAPLVLSGRFVSGLLWQASFLPMQGRAYLRIACVTTNSRTELVFDDGWPGPCQLTKDNGGEEIRRESFGAFHPWAALVDVVEKKLDDWRRRKLRPRASGVESAMGEAGTESQPPRWQDAIRALELDEAVRRSVERRRAYVLDLQEATEEASFKGAMTLVGCSLLWLSLVLLLFSVWLPWLGYLIPVAFAAFLLLQLLGVVPRTQKQAKEAEPASVEQIPPVVPRR